MATQVGEVYLCKICGNKVEVVGGGVGTLVCCGEPMVNRGVSYSRFKSCSRVFQHRDRNYKHMELCL